MTNRELEDLREFCVNRWPEEMGVIHGVGHWDRVAQFGKMLYQEGADMDVIMCFAYLHDSERINNSVDDEHGFRASLFIDTIRDTYLKALSDEQIATLKMACEMHTVVPRTGDITVNICFDSDRMDLLRVGIMPLPERMATRQGAELVADSQKYLDFSRPLILNSDACDATYISVVFVLELIKMLRFYFFTPSQALRRFGSMREVS